MTDSTTSSSAVLAARTIKTIKTPLNFRTCAGIVTQSLAAAQTIVNTARRSERPLESELQMVSA